jgi:protein O-mannosyl-transferase
MPIKRNKRTFYTAETPKTTAEPGAPKPSNRLRILLLILLSLTVIVSFSPILQNGFINLDDDKYVIENTNIQNGINFNSIKWAFTTGYSSNWHPLTWLSHMLDWHLFTNNPRGHHLINLLLHMINTLLLFLFLNKFTGNIHRSFIVAILFGIHPLHVESVAWVAERKDVLSTLFWFLSMWTYCIYVKNRKPLSYSLLLFFFSCGLMSKPMAITLPCVLLLLDFWPLDAYAGQSSFKLILITFSRLVMNKFPLFVLSIFSGIITYSVQHGAEATVTLKAMPLINRFANAIMSYGIYLYKMIVPADLAVFYPLVIEKTSVWLITFVCIALFTLSAIFIRYSRRYPYLLSGWLWYVGTLVPVIGIIQVGYQAYADRYSYIPLIGIFILCVWSIGDFVNKYTQLIKPALFVTVLTISSLAIRTHQQCKLWKSSEILFRHAVKCVPYNYLAFNNLGDALLTQERTDDAIDCFTKALALLPSYGLAHFNLGFQLLKRGHLEEARMHFENGLKDVPDDPRALITMGVICNQEKKYEEAIHWLKKANSFNPALMDSWLALGYAYANAGDLERSFESYYTATQLGCNKPEIYNAMGELQRALKRHKESYAFFEKAVRLKPDFILAYQNYAKALTAEGKGKEAEAILKKIELSLKAVP